MRICGIDEAGKGPLIGDMVIAGCLVEDEKEIESSGAKDSKALSPKQREELYKKIISMVKDYKVVRVSAQEIDERSRIGCNLNKLEAIKMAEIINDLKPDKAIIDCPHPTPSRFKAEIRRYLDSKDVEIVAEHRADANYPLVGAASIVAKVTRDRHIRELEKELHVSIGSGYPHDPITLKLLDAYFKERLKRLSPFIRHSWETFRSKKKENEQDSVLDYL